MTHFLLDNKTPCLAIVITWVRRRNRDKVLCVPTDVTQPKDLFSAYNDDSYVFFVPHIFFMLQFLQPSSFVTPSGSLSVTPPPLILFTALIITDLMSPLPWQPCENLKTGLFEAHGGRLRMEEDQVNAEQKCVTACSCRTQTDTELE